MIFYEYDFKIKNKENCLYKLYVFIVLNSNIYILIGVILIILVFDEWNIVWCKVEVIFFVLLGLI